jgi:tight adherence protein B
MVNNLPLAGAASSNEVYIVAGLAFLAITAAAYVLLSSWSRERKRTLAEEIERYGSIRARRDEESDGSLLRAALGMSQRFVTSGGFEERMAQALDRAGLALRPPEWVLIRFGAGVLLTALLLPLTGNLVFAPLFGGLAAWLGTRFFLSARTTRRYTAFGDQLPEALQLISGSLRAGFTVSQALERIAEQNLQPLAGEMARAVTQARLGMSVEDALDQVADRMDCPDLGWVVMAIRIQREVGGNLADIIDTTVDTMRERTHLRRHVRALAAEGRLSAYILFALPALMAIVLMVLRPAYIRPLFHEPLGVTLLVVGGGLMGAGWLWMVRIVKVEV